MPELIAAMAILAILSSIAVFSLTGFIGKAKQQRYILEAQEVRRSLGLYLLDQYYDRELDGMSLMADLSMADLTSPDHPLAGYLTITCTEGASIEKLTIDGERLAITEITYQVAGYEVEISEGKVNVTWSGQGPSSPLPARRAKGG